MDLILAGVYFRMNSSSRREGKETWDASHPILQTADFQFETTFLQGTRAELLHSPLLHDLIGNSIALSCPGTRHYALMRRQQ